MIQAAFPMFSADLVSLPHFDGILRGGPRCGSFRHLIYFWYVVHIYDRQAE